MNPSDRPIPTARGQAAAALGLPQTADGPAARSAFLRRLAVDDFAPPEVAVAAVNELAGAGAPLTPAAAAESAADIRGEVDAFVADYWTLPPAARRARWEDLSARCRDRQTALFLKHLELGLGVVVGPGPDPRVTELAALVRELFLLRPQAWAVRRVEWLAGLTERKDWGDAAARLKATDPATAALEPSLLTGLQSPTVLLPVAAAVAAADRRALTRDDMEQARQAGRDLQQRLAAGGRSGHSRLSRFGGYAVLVGIGIILKACAVVVLRDSPPPRPYTPPAVPRQSYLPDGADPTGPMVFTPEQIKAFVKYDPTSGQPAPPGYSQWIGQFGAVPATPWTTRR